MIIGIDLGGTSLSLGLLDGKNLIKKISVPSPADKDVDESLQILIDAIRLLTDNQIEGIGIGVPSVVDIEKGIVYNVANIPSWTEVHLKTILEKEFNVPVFVNNDSNCFALGEKRFGKGLDYDNLLAITLGTGVGAGVIINNDLYCGPNVGAGEIGCIKYLDGVYEDYCASDFFKRFHNTSGRDAAEGAENGDDYSLKIWDAFGTHMGNLIQTALFAYDAESIILGGSISKAYQYFEKSLWENLEEFPYPNSLKNLTINVSDNPDIAILGAASLVKV